MRTLSANLLMSRSVLFFLFKNFRTPRAFSSSLCQNAVMLRVVLTVAFMSRQMLRAVFKLLQNWLRMSRVVLFSCVKTCGLSTIALERYSEASSLFDGCFDESQNVLRIFVFFYLHIKMSRAISSFLLHVLQISRGFLLSNSTSL
jgi:hypothetical protein